MNAFWKKIAIPGYTMGFSAEDDRFTGYILLFFLHIYDLTVPHVENEPSIFGLYNILLASDSMCTIKLKTHF